MAPEGGDLERLPRHRDVVGLQAPRRRIEVRSREPRLGVGRVARADVEPIEGRIGPRRGVHARPVPRVRRAAREVNDVGRQRERQPAPRLQVQPDDAVAPEDRHTRVAVDQIARHEERAPGGLVDARRIAEAGDGGQGEGVGLDLHLAAAQRRVDPELVHLAHREREPSPELHVRVAGRDLDPGRRVGDPELGRVDRIAEARLVVLLELRLVVLCTSSRRTSCPPDAASTPPSRAAAPPSSGPSAAPRSTRLIHSPQPLSSTVTGPGTACPWGVRGSKCCATIVVSVTSSWIGLPLAVPTSVARARAGTRSDARLHERRTIRRRTGRGR